jgi:hypothetical protein
MKGQWIGKFTGPNTGVVIINVDDRDDYYEGVAYIFVDGSKPIRYAKFRTKDKNRALKLNKLRVDTIERDTGLIESWEAVKTKYGEDIVFPSHVDVEGDYNQERLKIKWKTENGVESSCELPKSGADKASALIPLPIDSWSAYKGYVATLKERRFIFRGQDKPDRLRTKFHRTGRANLERFVTEDRMILYRHLSARTHHTFNLEKPDENGAFFNLVQHHGYPTPLLDWTYSPYVAAFFAYRDITNLRASEAADTDKVRIFILDKYQWETDIKMTVMLCVPFLHVSILEFIAINNERMIPQQAVTTVTNIDDIESYIKYTETKQKKEYLSVIDLPVRDRKLIMHDLSSMGITAGSLFPGLDGACEELKERYFDI